MEAILAIDEAEAVLWTTLDEWRVKLDATLEWAHDKALSSSVPLEDHLEAAMNVWRDSRTFEADASKRMRHDSVVSSSAWAPAESKPPATKPACPQMLDDPNAPSSAPLPKVSTIGEEVAVGDSGPQGKTSEEARPETNLSTPPQHPKPDTFLPLVSMILTAPPPSNLPAFVALDMEEKLKEFRNEALRRRIYHPDMSLFSFCRQYRQIRERRMQQQMRYPPPALTVLPVLSPLPIQSIVPSPDVEDKFRGCLAELMFAMGSRYHKWGQWNYRQCITLRSELLAGCPGV